jgi:hypothetical protein
MQMESKTKGRNVKGGIYISPYTKPDNCTDEFDCKVGIDCALASMEAYRNAGRNVPKYLYTRLHKLTVKLKQYEHGNN